MIEAILFDKDGTLFDFYGTWGVVTEEAALLAAEGEAARAADMLLRSGKDPKTGRFAPGSVIASGSNREIAALWAEILGRTDVEELTAAVREAHRNGVRVACHAQATEGIKNAARAGVDTIEHGSFLDEEGADLMLRHGTILVPTISVIWLYVNEGPNVGVPQWIAVSNGLGWLVGGNSWPVNCQVAGSSGLRWRPA